jgi:hypothetical protein
MSVAMTAMSPFPAGLPISNKSAGRATRRTSPPASATITGSWTIGRPCSRCRYFGLITNPWFYNPNRPLVNFWITVVWSGTPTASPSTAPHGLFVPPALPRSVNRSINTPSTVGGITSTLPWVHSCSDSKPPKCHTSLGDPAAGCCRVLLSLSWTLPHRILPALSFDFALAA